MVKPALINMAITNSPILGIDAHGKLTDALHLQRRYNGVCIRQTFTPKDTKSDLQLSRREWFSSNTTLWKDNIIGRFARPNFTNLCNFEKKSVTPFARFLQAYMPTNNIIDQMQYMNDYASAFCTYWNGQWMAVFTALFNTPGTLDAIGTFYTSTFQTILSFLGTWDNPSRCRIQLSDARLQFARYARISAKKNNRHLETGIHPLRAF